MKKVVFWGLLISLVLAVILAPFACLWPDGLEKVAEDLGFSSRGENAGVFHSPMPDYAISGVENEAIATAAAGVVGTLIAFGVVYGVGRLVKKRTRNKAEKGTKIGA